MKLRNSKVVDRKQYYIDSMERWLEIAVFDEDYLQSSIIADLDLTDMEIDTYRTELLKKWPGFGYLARLAMSLDPTAQKEVYDLIVKENPCLHPRNVVQIQGVSDRITFEHEEIARWFRTLRAQGDRPEVIDGQGT